MAIHESENDKVCRQRFNEERQKKTTNVCINEAIDCRFTRVPGNTTNPSDMHAAGFWTII
jgi:hypothetical protein